MYILYSYICLQHIIRPILYFVAVCNLRKIDIVFVLDSFISIKNDANFVLIRNLVTEVAEVLTINPNHAIFSVILFGRHAWIKFPISEYNNTDDLIQAVNNITYNDASKENPTGSNLPEAFNLIINAPQNGKLGVRSDSDYKSTVFVPDSRINTRNLVEKQLNKNIRNNAYRTKLWRYKILAKL